MDITTYLQCFESTISSYTGEDLLDPWLKFVEYLEHNLPAAGPSEMSVVFRRLVERFLNVDTYANDIRYVNFCIKCASYSSNPTMMYSYIHGKGIGSRTAALYLAWARQFEDSGMNEQADGVYHKAIENQAQPVDTVLHEYRQFQTRTTSHSSGSGGPNPLQNSHLTNQMLPHREPVAQMASVDCMYKPKTIIVSRSETSGMIPSSKDSNVQTVSEYMKEKLVCEGSELSFEEVRAEKYFRELKEKQKYYEQKVREQNEEGIVNIESMLDKINQDLGIVTNKVSSQKLSLVEPVSSLNPYPTQQSFEPPRPSNLPSSRCSLGLRLYAEPTFIQEAAAVPEPPKAADMSAMLQAQEDARRQLGSLEKSRSQEHSTTHDDVTQLPEPEEKLNVSVFHITPNNSLGFVQATPSRVLPSPTVNTREALDVIMDMFQAPTLLDDPFSSTSLLQTADAKHTANGAASSFSKPPTAAPFTIFQDDADKENGSAAGAAAPVKPQPVRALAEIAASKPGKPNDTAPDLMPDESTMWGARYNSLNSLAACPNSTTDFAMLAQFVSTPFTHKTPFNFYQDKENHCDGSDADADAFIRRQSKKLSPIIEQSPSDEKLSETAVSRLVPSSERQGTIVGEGLPSAHHCLTTSSITMVQPAPPAVLSFRDQTLCPTDSRTAGPGWEVYTSPEPPAKETSLISHQPESSLRPKGEPFQIMEDLDQPRSPEQAQAPAYRVPMSPECAVRPDWLDIASPQVTTEPDLNAFLSPYSHTTADIAPNRIQDIPMSPEQRQLCADVPMSPAPHFGAMDEPMSPDRDLRSSVDVSMSATPPSAARTLAVRLVSNPWDNELISDLLSTLSLPLSSHPCCRCWQCNIPSISPKMTLRMGGASLRVDCVLGEGAFATVYQATDPVTSEKLVLKVQKPANPWEFYINTQLDARLQPDVRHLYSRIHSAHIFDNGSVLLSELHNYGTLLNAVNLYKTLSEKVMPPPLVMYFTVCILNMVEQLHRIHVIHADIKPDNFLLGKRFMENKCFDSESLDHGLVLVDFGQSIDMEMFPEGTAFTARCLTSGFQCTEMLSGKPWTYQTDYFGIAGTVYCMLFGTYMQVTNEDGVWKTNAVFRRNPHSDLWLQFFYTLLNKPDCGSLRSLRCRLASVLQQDYGSKLSTLKSRLVVLLLESRKGARR